MRISKTEGTENTEEKIKKKRSELKTEDAMTCPELTWLPACLVFSTRIMQRNA